MMPDEPPPLPPLDAPWSAWLCVLRQAVEQPARLPRETAAALSERLQRDHGSPGALDAVLTLMQWHHFKGEHGAAVPLGE